VTGHDGEMTSSGEARLPVRGPEDDPRLAELFAKGLNGPDGRPLNIFGTLGHHPDLLRRWLVFAAHVLSKNTLTPRDRELLILRTGWNCRSRYEWGQHVVIARQCDISDDEIERVKAGPEAEGWAPYDRLLLTAADELHTTSSLGDSTWTALGDHLSAEQVLDLVATVGNYHLVAMFLNSTRVELDAGVPSVEMPPVDMPPVTS
jgi:4-carboxymuconolactone decarboxylase